MSHTPLTTLVVGENETIISLKKGEKHEKYQNHGKTGQLYSCPC